MTIEEKESLAQNFEDEILIHLNQIQETIDYLERRAKDYNGEDLTEDLRDILNEKGITL